MEKFELFKLVTQRPDEKLTVSNAVCPFCNSANYQSKGIRSTLLAFNNHTWNHRKCNGCQKNYVVEEKSGNVWVTDENANVLKGIPSCYENYIYDCNCGGKVKREYRGLDNKPTNFLSSSSTENGWVKHYKTFFKCDTCHTEIETENDYYKK
jgi:hypothetical protein